MFKYIKNIFQHTCKTNYCHCEKNPKQSQEISPKQLWQNLNLKESEYKLIEQQLKREPNLTEVYLFSAMWSEHCGYKHSKKLLELLPKQNAVLSEENAGGVQIGDHVIFFKMESHNHPSAVEPYQGAATGIGGIIRDVLALGARPIALLDSLKFGDLKDKKTRYLLEGVVKGISDYGNSIGVPTIAGETFFDKNYSDSPLVNVMAVGIAHKDKIKLSSAKPEQSVILVGSATGRDGIHGASFASKELGEDYLKDRPSVQIADPFMKKILIEATLQILKLNCVSACQDCGAAGLLSSTSEMAYKGNCQIDLYLDKVNVREEKMQPWEIMLSESQERMVFLVDIGEEDKVIEICKKYEIPYSICGKTKAGDYYNLYYNDKKVAGVPVKMLNEAHLYELKEIDIPSENGKVEDKKATKDNILKILSDPSIADKQEIYKQYDYSVGNRTAIYPGANSSGLYIEEENCYIGLSIDSRPLQVQVEPYTGTLNTVYEGYRNLVSNGFEPLGITDCLNFGNPEKEENANQLVKSINGLKDACNQLNMPVVSGNVSLYNESEKYSVYPTPTIGMVGVSKSKPIKSIFNKGEHVLLIGKHFKEFVTGANLYQKILYNKLEGINDKIDSEYEIKLKNTIFDLRDRKALSGCIDVSLGGVLTALVKCISKGNTGFKFNNYSSNTLFRLFGELNSQYLLSTDDLDLTSEILTKNKIDFCIQGKCYGDKIIIDDNLSIDKSEIFNAYQNGLKDAMEL